MSGLHLLAIEVTSRCNLACAHCYGDFQRHGADLPIEWAEEIAAQAAELGVRIVTLTGGEPLLLGSALPFYIGLFQARGMRVFLTTNAIGVGSLATETTLHGLSGVQVSLDGIEATHDRNRGRGTFCQAIAGIRTLVGWGIPTNIMMTLNADNVYQIEKLFHLCHDLGANLSLERCSPPYHDRGGPAPPSQAAVLSGFRFAAAHRVHSYDPCYAAFKFYESGTLPPAGRAIQGGCTAGIAALAVTAGLDILACVRLRGAPLGNLKKDTLKAIWCGGSVIDHFRDRSLLAPPCGNCEYRAVCGGCRANALSDGDVLGADPGCPLSPKKGESG